MVWVSNQSGADINVSITYAGAPASVFPVAAVGLESFATNHWGRDAASSETAYVHVGGTTVTVPDVHGNDFLIIYRDSFIKTPTTAVSQY